MVCGFAEPEVGFADDEAGHVADQGRFGIGEGGPWTGVPTMVPKLTVRSAMALCGGLV